MSVKQAVGAFMLLVALVNVALFYTELGSSVVSAVQEAVVAQPTGGSANASAKALLSRTFSRLRSPAMPSSSLALPGWLVTLSGGHFVHDVLFVADFQYNGSSRTGIYVTEVNQVRERAPVNGPLSNSTPFLELEMFHGEKKESFRTEAAYEILVANYGDGKLRRGGDGNHRNCVSQWFYPLADDAAARLRALPVDEAYLKISFSSRAFVYLRFNLGAASDWSTRFLTRRVTAKRRDSPDKHTVAACMEGVWGQTPYVRELVQLQLTQGFDHVYLGAVETAVEELAHTLADFLAEGRVSIIQSSVSPSASISVHEKSPDCWVKVPFLQSCIYHSKNFDKWTAVYDQDEILIWNDTSVPAPQVFEENFAKHNSQCQLRLRTRPGMGKSNWDRTKAYYGEAFPLMASPELEGRFSFHRGVALTQRATFGSIHCLACGTLEPGFCEGYPWGTDLKPGQEADIYDLVLVHENNLRTARNDFAALNRSLYVEWWFPTIKQRLLERCTGAEPLFCPPFGITGASSWFETEK